MPDEVEGKLVLTSPKRPEVLEEVAGLSEVGGFTVVGRSDHSLSDAYFDTTNRDLAGAGLALRIRTEDGTERLTLKGDPAVDSGVVSRFEFEEDWSPEALQEVLEAMGEAGVRLDTANLERGHGATVALESLGFRPTAPRTNNRTVLELADGENGLVAEVDVDRVIFTIGDKKVRHYEIECEAHSGKSSDSIRAVLSDLRSRFTALTPVTYSKLALAEHLEQLERSGHLTELLDGETLTREAYTAIGRILA